MVKLTSEDHARLSRVVKEPFYVYIPSNGGGRDWATLINAGLVQVDDVGDDQETILRVSATDAGRAALADGGRDEQR